MPKPEQRLQGCSCTILLNVKKAGAKADARIIDFSTKNFVVNICQLTQRNVTKYRNVHILPHGNIFIKRFGQ
jgi:hypothetical protein